VPSSLVHHCYHGDAHYGDVEPLSYTLAYHGA
jgi:hypothetical protein